MSKLLLKSRCLSVLLSFVLPFPVIAQKPGEQKSICSQPIPAGWVCSEVGALCEGGNPFTLDGYKRKITYYVGLPTGAKLFVSADVTPQGWVNTSSVPGPTIPSENEGNLGSRVFYNHDILKIEGMPNGSEVQIFDDLPPAGWTQSDVKAYGLEDSRYYSIIKRIDSMPAGTVLNLVNNLSPAGWITIDVGNKKLIKRNFLTRKVMKFQGSDVHELDIVEGYTPDGWIATDFGEKLVETGRYETRKIVRINSMDVTKSYTFLGQEPPEGWIITARKYKNVDDKIYEIKTIRNYKHLQPGSELTIVGVKQPAGWVTTDISTFTLGNSIFESRKILKLDGDDQINEISIVDQLAPEGWVPVDVDTELVGKTIYTRLKIVRLSTMDPAKEYTLAILAPPQGWLATGLTTKMVGNSAYELLKITNILNLPMGTTITAIDTWPNVSLPPAGWSTQSTGEIKGLATIYKTYIIKKQETRVNGIVSGIWTKRGNPYRLFGEAIVPESVKLTIEPGVEVYSGSDNDRLTIDGTITAEGTAQEPILFQGISDPTGQNLYNPRPGGYMTINSTSKNSILNFVTIDHWGDNYREQNAIIINSSDVTIKNSIVKNSLYNGILINEGFTPTITGNEFSNNPQSIQSRVNDLTNTVSNKAANIRLISSQKENENLLLKNPGQGSYYFFPVGFQVNPGTTLTIEPGTEMRWSGFNKRYPDIFTVFGTLIARGTEKDSIRFIGNENWKNDEEASPPGYIRFAEQSRNNELKYVAVDKLGTSYEREQEGALIINTTSFHMQHATIRKSASVGIDISKEEGRNLESLSPLIAESSIFNNDVGVRVYSGSPVISNCQVYNNKTFGIENLSSLPDTVDARNVFWGDKSGPYHKTLNPQGKGNPVSDKVKFKPFKTGSGKDQSITFKPFKNIRYGDPDIIIEAVSSSGLPVSFRSTDTAVAKVNGSSIEIQRTGKVSIIARQSGDGTFNAADSVVRELVIVKAPLNITVDSKEKKFGAKNPEFTIRYDGFVGNEDQTVLSKLPVVQTTALEDALPGNYPIKASGAEAMNYEISYVPGILKVIRFNLDASNFKLANTGTSCIGMNNGTIHITAEKPLAYVATITGPGINGQIKPFTEELTLENLIAGSYNICITLPEEPGYKQCFTSVVSEPPSLQVYTDVVKSSNQVLVSLQGGNSYQLLVNGKAFTTKNSQITLDLKAGLNVIEVSTEKPCQGTITRDIIISDNTLPFPNPFREFINLNFGEKHLASAFITIYDRGNTVVFRQSYSGRSGIVQIDVPELDPGIYFLKFSADHIEKVYKIQKNQR